MMELTNNSISRTSAVLSWTHRVVVPLLLIALCLLIDRKYRTAVLVLGTGFLAAMIVLPV
jgi:hypothetical protein